MELITPKVEIWQQDTTNLVRDMWRHIARCTRVCYQSEKKDNEETEEDFVKRVILRHEPWSNEANHLAMLEHGTIYLKGKDEVSKSLLISHYSDNKYSRFRYIPDNTRGIANYVITTNLRVLVENGWLDDLAYICAPTEHHIRRVTVCFTTNIGVTREFNRHRVNSIAEESTRYCNYNKRNSGQLKVTLPTWLKGEEIIPYIESHQFDTLDSYVIDIYESESDEKLFKSWSAIDYYLCSLTVAQWAYNNLIKKGWTPQQAREVLPLATKSQLIHTAFVDDWKHFFALRANGISGTPHPNAKELATDLKNKFIKAGYLK